MVLVSLAGDAIRASLVAKRGSIPLPGKAPAGSYRIYASFEGEPEVAVGTATVVEGQPLTVRCDSQFGKCAASGAGP